MASSNAAVLPIFNGENFSNWKFRVLMLLEEKGIKEVVTRDGIDYEDKENLLKDIKAKSVIVQCVGDKHLEYIKDAKTAKEMFESLSKVYERRSIFSKLYLRKKLLSLTYKVSESLEEHFVKFDSLIRDLENCMNNKLSEDDKVCHNRTDYFPTVKIVNMLLLVQNIPEIGFLFADINYSS